MIGRYVMVDGFAHEVRIVEGDGSYEFLKEQLDDVTMSVTVRRIKGKMYDMWIDDEFLLKDYEGNPLACVCADFDEVLLGKVLIANRDEEGNTTPLSDEEVDEIVNSARVGHMRDGSAVCVMVYTLK